MSFGVSSSHERSIALMKFLSAIARSLGVAEHVYVVGGAVRNFLLGVPIKDIDIVIDSLALKGKDSAWFAKEVQKAIPTRTNLTTNNYGVAILSISDSWDLDGNEMKGEVIEIANARQESYGGAEGKGYKPDKVEPATIEQDLARREFTFNTLLFRLLDLEHGPDRAEVLDLTGLGRQHLEERLLSTPVDPDKTFADDPTRMLRAIKFVAKYGFKIAPEVRASIERNASKLKAMPWEAVYKLLTDDILGGPSPRRSVELLKDLGLAPVIKEMLELNPGFAAALGRSLTETETHLLLDLLDLGWSMRTPLSFLSREQQARLREILLSYPEGDGKDFVEALKKPPIDQAKFFERYSIPPKERGSVQTLARQLLLADPSLIWGWGGLEQMLDARLQKTYGPPLAEKVAAEFLRRVSSEKP
jgi:tRNA nucleotidyltransferase/poly(A) polymerase